MKYYHLFCVTSVLGAYVPASPWSNLTPTGTAPAGAITSASGSFAISIGAILTAAANDKRGLLGDLFGGSKSTSTGKLSVTPTATVKSHETAAELVVSQITDGQIQAETTAIGTVVHQITGGLTQAETTTHGGVIDQITDGQIQAETTAAGGVLNQITDGQIQAETTAAGGVLNQITDGQIQAETTAAGGVLNQITDGQVQAQTATVLAQIGDGQVQAQTATVLAQIGDGQVQAQSIVNQIGDGQIQQQQTASAVVNQITDGQIQQQTTAAVATDAAVNQITDGQIQQTTAGVQQISDGQAQAQPTAGTLGTTTSQFKQTCVNSNSLVITLKNGELTDSHGRIGAIVANRQFQFDGPPPQAGTIYAGGWSIVPSSTGIGKLALGDQTTFYKCLSGDFYNLYDQSIGGQCSPVEFYVLLAVHC